ncbi:MAG: hypothetical protein KGJ36_00230 [Acidobacteriota bacterium]|nr:hypothetical protein [Acidobacteriota bacterium]
MTIPRVPGLARYVLARPWRAVTLARAGWRLRRNGWWRRAPFLPVPDERYWRFRVTTAMGREGTPTPRDVVDAARWALSQRVGK